MMMSSGSSQVVGVMYWDLAGQTFVACQGTALDSEKQKG